MRKKIFKKISKKNLKKVSTKKNGKSLRAPKIAAKKSPAITPNTSLAPKTSFSFTSHADRIRRSFAQIRHLAVWSFALILVLGGLSFLASRSPAAPEGTPAKRSAFQEKLLQVSTLNLMNDEEDGVTLIATGDINPARYVELKMRIANDYTYPFHKVADFLKSADVTFGNLDSPLLPGRNVPKDTYTFRADPKSAEGLAFAGFDIVSIANNQMMNRQTPGLTSTIQALRGAGIQFAGAGKNLEVARTPVVVEAKGRKIAFLAYNDANIPPKFHGEAGRNTPGIAKMDIGMMKEDVAAAKATGAHFVVVYMHAGREYAKEPNQFQKDFAHGAIDSGASVVIGSHTHSVQPVEHYGSGLILYSLGNFVSDQFFDEDVKTGLIAKILLQENKSPRADFFPTKNDESVQPRILEGEEREQAIAALGLR